MPEIELLFALDWLSDPGLVHTLRAGIVLLTLALVQLPALWRASQTLLGSKRAPGLAHWPVRLPRPGLNLTHGLLHNDGPPVGV